MTIRAGLIRTILLGLEIGGLGPLGGSAAVRVSQFGIRLRPAVLPSRTQERPVRVAGKLDLRGMSSPGGQPLPPLALEYCRFDADAPIDLEGISVGALSLKGSRFTALRLSDAGINGALDLSECGPLPAPVRDLDRRVPLDQAEHWPFAGTTFTGQAESGAPPFAAVPAADRPPMLPSDHVLSTCVVLLDNARIDGTCDLSYADFVRTRDQICPFRGDATTLKVAVQLFGTHVQGRLALHRTVIVGGLMLQNADILEDAQLFSVRIFAYVGDTAIHLQLTRIGGALLIRPMGGSSIRDREEFTHNVIVGGLGGIGLTANLFWIGAAVIFPSGVPLPEADDGAQQELVSWAVHLPNANIGGGMTFGYYDKRDPTKGCRILGATEVSASRIGHSLKFRDWSAPAAGGSEPRVEELLAMETPFVRRTLGYRHRMEDRHCGLIAQRMTIQQEFEISRCCLQGATTKDAELRSSVDLRRSNVERGVWIDAQSTLEGAVRLSLAHIGRTLSVQARSLVGIPDVASGNLARAIDGRSMVVNGDVRIGPKSGDAMRCEGTIILASARIDGSLELQRIRMILLPRDQVRGTEDYSRTIISLKEANIAGRFAINALAWQEREQAEVPPDQANAAGGAVWANDAVLTFHTLPCYEGVELIEARSGDLRRRYLRVGGSDELVPLDGSASRLHALNRATPSRLRLDSDEARRSYLTLFCDSTQGDEGTFRLVGTVSGSAVDGLRGAIAEWDTLPDGAAAGGGEEGEADGTSDPAVESDAARAIGRRVADALLAQRLGKGPIPSEVRAEEPDTWRYDAPLLYADTLRAAQFELTREGNVTMVEETPLIDVGRPDRDRAELLAEDQASADTDRSQAPANGGVARDRGLTRPVAAPPGIGLVPLGREVGTLGQVLRRWRAPGALIPAKDATPAADLAIDLTLGRCGYLDDGHGEEWHLATMDRLHLVLTDFQCGGAEPARERTSAGDGASDVRAAFGRGIALAALVDPDGAEKRISWLGRQFRGRGTDWNRKGFLRRRAENQHVVQEKDFVPHAWDLFANTYFRMGDRRTARNLLIERRDLEAWLLHAEIEKHLDGVWLGNASLREPWAIGANRTTFAFLCLAVASLAALSLLGRTQDGLYALPAALAAGVLVYLAVPLRMRRRWAAAAGIAAGLAAMATAWASGHTEQWLLVVPAWLIAGLTLYLLLPGLTLLANWLFRTGFSYGLNPGRALITFVAMIALGAFGTHWARTGGPPSVTTPWNALYDPTRAVPLDERIALVLDAGYGTEHGKEMPPGYGVPGYAVYAAPTPCNLGVSSVLYALDLFIPVLDLDQTSRCTIREVSERGADGRFVGHWRYFLWRIAKTVYEILGWIVTSLTILTVTGVLRRDLER